MSRTVRRRLVPIGLPVVFSLTACVADEVGDSGATGGYAGTGVGGAQSVSGAGGGAAAGGTSTSGTGGTTAAGGATSGGTAGTTATGGMTTGGSAGSVTAGGTAGAVSAGGAAGAVSAGGTAGTGPIMVDCSGISNAGHELCSESAEGCGAVFTDGAGCTAVCAAAGLTCVSASENLDDSCGPDTSRPEIACDSGHQSDFCQCGGPVVGTGGSGGTGERTYTVESGDTLSHIAKAHYGKAGKWRAIFEANRDQIDDPDRIFPGQVLQLPALDD